MTKVERDTSHRSLTHKIATTVVVLQMFGRFSFG